MSKTILLFVLIISTSLKFYSQVNVNSKSVNNNKHNFQIVFIEPKSSISKDNIIDYPEYSLTFDTGKPVLPSKNLLVLLPPNSKIDLQLTNQKYNIIENAIPASAPEIIKIKDSLITYKESQLDENLFINENYPDKEFEIIGYKWMKDFYVAEVKVNTHRFNWRKKIITSLLSTNIEINIKGISSFMQNNLPLGDVDKELAKLFVNSEDASKYKSINPNIKSKLNSDDWIDYTKEYIKLGIIKDGIHRIGYEDLLASGLNPQTINPKTFKLFKKGKQIPIYIEGESDNSFDANDFIEFYAEKNYSGNDYTQIVPIGTDYNNYMDRYNDTTHVWLTWDGNDGERINIYKNLKSTIDTIYESKVKIHQEKDVRLWYYDAVTTRTNLPFWQEHKVWTWQVIGNSGSIAFPFESFDVVTDSKVKITARLISNASNLQINAHKIGSSLNSTSPKDTINFDYKKTVNFTTTFNSSNLISGKNIYRIFGLPSTASFHQTLIDWVDIEYLKYNKALKDSVLIVIPEGYSTGEKNIKITNVNSSKENLVLYKISPIIKKIITFDFSNGTLIFSDTISANDKFLLVSKDFTQKPVFNHKKVFKNIRKDNGGADYILVSNKLLQSSAIEYENFISSNYNLRTRLVFVDDIYDEFNYGNTSAESIKDFISYAYSSWTLPKPKYLLLIGDANYDYKDVLEPAPSIRKKNLVPSFGMPVSDVWFTTLDSTNLIVQFLYVGRIPANNNEEVLHYLQKHKEYITRKVDDWNKRYLFFSGGDPTNVSELEQIKVTNDYLINNLISVKPIGGYSQHFYKTLNPASNYGPYSKDELQKEINESSLFISYIGHSGTQTWDNGITSVKDLKNNYEDRFPLITDFGCSTGRFAEPDVNAFSELFIAQSNDGQAINYLGNSSYGYLSTSLSFPKKFYETLLKDTINSIGKIHFLSKQLLLINYGSSEVNKVFYYCNLLFGDPIIKFALPKYSELSIAGAQLSIQNPSDNLDSIDLNIQLKNFGKVVDDELYINVKDNFNSKEIFNKNIIIPCPFYNQNLIVKIPINKRAGLHELKISINNNHTIKEYNYDDNVYSFSFNIYSSSVRSLLLSNYYSAIQQELRIINPQNTIRNDDKITIQISDRADFSQSIQLTKSLDTLFTKFDISNFQNQKRYWFRTKLNNDIEWSEPISFFKTNSKINWRIDTLINKNEIIFSNTKYDSAKKGITLSSKQNQLKITSAGSNDGKFASFIYNGDEKLLNTYFWGIATAIIDSVTYEPRDIKYFIYPSSTSAPALIQYLQGLPQNTMIAFAICDDGAQSVLGFSAGTAVRNEIKNFGSALIDQVKYRESWCMIGKKGAATGSVPEVYKKLFDGMAIIEQKNFSAHDSGLVTFPKIKNISKIENIFKSDSLNIGNEINYYLYGIKDDSQIDFISNINFVGNVAELNKDIDYKYKEVFIKADMFSTKQKETPIIKTISAKLIPSPELGLNFQTVSISKDTIELGEKTKLTFRVYNAGETTAKFFKIKVEAVSKNESSKLFEQVVDSIQFDKYKIFSIDFSTLKSSGSYNLNIYVDSENNIDELYEDNNFYSVPIYVKRNTKPAILNLTIDGNDIMDGDYVSSNPKIKIELRDESLVPILDTTKVSIYLNNKRISYKGNENQILYSFSQSNPKYVVEYTPIFEDGEYTLKVIGKNGTDELIDSTSVIKRFKVKNSLELIELYNYPNPMKDETDFTFKLTSVPDEMKINIYTIAGRKIKEIKLSTSQLKHDFNTIHWNGRDEDGNKIANGIYLCKVILKKENRTIDKITKLAKVE